MACLLSALFHASELCLCNHARSSRCVTQHDELELAEKNYQEGAALMKTGAPTPTQLLLNMNAVSLPPSARTTPSGTLETRFSALRDAKLTPWSWHAADKLDFDHVLELLGTSLQTKYGLSLSSVCGRVRDSWYLGGGGGS